MYHLCVLVSSLQQNFSLYLVYDKVVQIFVRYRSHFKNLGAPDWWDKHKYTNPGLHVRSATKFWTVVPNIYGILLWNLLNVTHLATTVLRRFPHFGKFVQFPYWGPTNVRIHHAKFSSLPHDLAVVPNICGFSLWNLLHVILWHLHFWGGS